MAIEVKGVRRNLRRRRWTGRRFTRTPKKYTGQKGWNWTEVILSNQFTEIDNSPGTRIGILTGDMFETVNSESGGSENIGGVNARTVVVRSVRMQAQVSITPDDDQAYPLVAWDVALVKFEGVVPLSQEPAGSDVRGITLVTNNRTIWHRRVWTTIQGAIGEFGEGEESVYGVDPASSFLDVYLPKLNLPLSEKESMALCLTQCGSELYASGSAALLTGYVKSFVQLK